MSYTAYCVARIDQKGDTTYLNVAGSWHETPVLATAFFGKLAVSAALRWTSMAERIEYESKTYRYTVMETTTTVEEVEP